MCLSIGRPLAQWVSCLYMFCGLWYFGRSPNPYALVRLVRCHLLSTSTVHHAWASLRLASSCPRKPNLHDLQQALGKLVLAQDIAKSTSSKKIRGAPIMHRALLTPGGWSKLFHDWNGHSSRKSNLSRIFRGLKGPPTQVRCYGVALEWCKWFKLKVQQRKQHRTPHARLVLRNLYTCGNQFCFATPIKKTCSDGWRQFHSFHSFSLRRVLVGEGTVWDWGMEPLLLHS